MSALSAIKIWAPPVVSMTKGRKGFRSISDLISSIFNTATYGIKMPAQEGDGLGGTGHHYYKRVLGSLYLVHRLAYNGDVVAFKMSRRQDGVGEASRLASSRRAKLGRFAYIT
jgi:hypothetical protein